MSFPNSYPAYVSMSEVREKADRQIAKLRKKNPNLSPVIIEGSSLATSWWGKAWNSNMESYADFYNRIGRGKSYAKNHAVLDLQITSGHVEALVQGTRAKPYSITISIARLDDAHWKSVVELCNHKIESIESLIEGKFPKELESLFRDQQYGLFPKPKEISFDCSCPDYAVMCKHVAAVFYGIGARLDIDPLLFFVLRGIDHEALIKKSIESKLENMLKNANKKSKRAIDLKKVHELFGI